MIEELIREIHPDDKEQLDAIFSEAKHVIVEAPAGYGKTRAMISRIAYLLAKKKLVYPKKILALTFSVNAAYKIKQDVAGKLPAILEKEKISPLNIGNRVLATNYHGFCRRLLKLYGYLIDKNLREVDLFIGVDDSNKDKVIELNFGLSEQEAKMMVAYNEAIKKRDTRYIKEQFDNYLTKVLEHFLPNKRIPFNAILLLVFKLFKEKDPILEFYRSFFPFIIVDEFQDTNILSWNLLKKLIGEETNIMFMGDSLQRIYGFIGAIPNLINKAVEKYKAEKIEFKKNYRFQDNEILLQLDKNIRENARDPRNPTIEKDAEVQLSEFSSQSEEAVGISQMVSNIAEQDSTSTVAVLVKQRGSNTQQILEEFRNRNITYFYALYSDEESEYIEFHQKSLEIFLSTIRESQGRINKRVSDKFINGVKRYYEDKKSEMSDSLIILLETFLRTVFKEYNFLTIEEKADFIKDTLENKALKQYLGYVDSQIIITTVHGAKGLEWDYVILPDMEQFSFPSWFGLCEVCYFNSDCKFRWDRITANSIVEKKFHEELSVFYVAATRAKKEILFSYSKKGLKFSGDERNNALSCFMRLKGIKPMIEVMQ
jgi:DNA helicase-2/ATP-dependent DNA helicase PcrA